MFSLPDTVPRVLHLLTHLILTATLWDRYNYHSRLRISNQSLERLNNMPTITKYDLESAFET